MLRIIADFATPTLTVINRSDAEITHTLGMRGDISVVYDIIG